MYYQFSFFQDYSTRFFSFAFLCKLENLLYLNGWHTLCSPKHFSAWHTLQTHTLHLRTFCSSTHFAPWNTLLPETLYSTSHFAYWNTLLIGTFCSFVKCFPQHTLLSGTQKAKCSWKQSVPWSKVCWGEKYSREQCVLRSKMCRSRVCQGVE